jgi:hypothetical protein
MKNRRYGNAAPLQIQNLPDSAAFSFTAFRGLLSKFEVKYYAKSLLLFYYSTVLNRGKPIST